MEPRTRPRRLVVMTVARLVLALVAVALAACGAQVPLTGSTVATGIDGPEPDRGGIGLAEPPPVTVRAGDATVDLRAWTFCYEGTCADGMQPANPPDLGRVPQVVVAFPLEGWSFEAEFVPVGEDCPRRQSIPVERTGEGTYLVEPAGRAGTYDVTLFGRGDGDLFVTFRWTTPNDGPMPVPAARIAVLADHDGAIDSYGVELELSDLAATPEAATARVTVTAANGKSLTFDATRAARCRSEGTVSWDGPDQPGLDALELGPRPFTYDVVVTLDGVVHSATAVWPDDQIGGNEPSVLLDFSPALPALP